MDLPLAIIIGAVFRRWWGDARPSWAFPGYRATQAIIGLAVLFGICWIGHSWRDAAIRSALAIGFITAIAQSIPHVWSFWDWVDSKISLRSRYRLLDGFTTYAELTNGAIVFGLAVVI